MRTLPSSWAAPGTCLAVALGSLLACSAAMAQGLPTVTLALVDATADDSPR